MKRTFQPSNRRRKRRIGFFARMATKNGRLVIKRRIETVKRTLCKTDKIRFKSEFDQIQQNGEKLVGSSMLVVYAPAPDHHLRCGVICGKKYSLLAVKRNRARRLLWESFRLLRESIEIRHLLLIPRRRMEKADRRQVTRELAGLLARAGLLPQEVADLPPEC